jgi:hypothetical protein
MCFIIVRLKVFGCAWLEPIDFRIASLRIVLALALWSELCGERSKQVQGAHWSQKWSGVTENLPS